MRVSSISFKNSQNKNIAFKSKARGIVKTAAAIDEAVCHKGRAQFQYELIDFFKGTRKFRQYFRSFINKRGNKVVQDTEIAKTGEKMITSKFFKNSHYSGAVPAVTKEKIYSSLPERKLISKTVTKDFNPKQHNDLVEKKVTTFYRADGKTPQKVVKTKRLQGQPYKRITTEFSENGTKKLQSKSHNGNWEWKRFDKTGEKVIDSDSSFNYLPDYLD